MGGRAKLQECYPREWFKQAPYYLIVCGDHQQSWKRGDHKDHMDIGTAIVMEYICLTAAEQGLGTRWVCNLDMELCRRHFKIPEMIEPVVLIPFSYPSDPVLFDETPKKRKPIGEIIERGSP